MGPFSTVGPLLRAGTSVDRASHDQNDTIMQLRAAWFERLEGSQALFARMAAVGAASACFAIERGTDCLLDDSQPPAARCAAIAGAAVHAVLAFSRRGVE